MSEKQANSDALDENVFLVPIHQASPAGAVLQPLAYPSVTSATLSELVRRLRSVGDPESIVLFGSHARGDVHATSDLDILIVEESELPRYRRASRYLRALVGLFPANDVVVWTPAEIEEWKDVPNAFITTALREGTVLYERSC